MNKKNIHIKSKVITLLKIDPNLFGKMKNISYSSKDKI